MVEALIATLSILAGLVAGWTWRGVHFERQVGQYVREIEDVRERTASLLDIS